MTEFKTMLQMGNTAALLAGANPTPAARQLVVETDTGRAKVGDGTRAYNALTYIGSATGGTVSVKDYGAVGDGVADDTAEIQACLNAAVAAGLTAYVPAGTYMINGATSILMNVAGMSLQMAPGAVLKVITNALANYSVVTVSAADCWIVGGTIFGDVQTHTGGTGEWGHGLTVTTGAHRFRAVRLSVRECWGDGIYVTGNVEDVTLLDCNSGYNRRQGLSIVGALAPRVIGGSYHHTGYYLATAPSAGIDVEPNPSSGNNALDFVVDGARCSNNVGSGILLVRATAQTTTGTVANCRLSANTKFGIETAGSAGSLAVELSNNTSSYNTKSGIAAQTPGVSVNGGRCYSNTESGIITTDSKTAITGGVYDFNGRYGIHASAASTNPSVAAAVVRDNCTSAATTYHEVYVAGTGAHLVGVNVRPASSGNRAIYGVKFETGATGGKVTGVVGAGTSGTVSPVGDSAQSVI
jgi:hypothetical protein